MTRLVADLGTKKFDDAYKSRSLEIIPVFKDVSLRTLSRRGLFDYLSYTEKGCLNFRDLHWNRKVLFTIGNIALTRSIQGKLSTCELNKENFLPLLDVAAKGKHSWDIHDNYQRVIDSVVIWFLRQVNDQCESYESSDMITCGKKSILIGFFIKLLKEGSLDSGDLALWEHIADGPERKWINKHAAKYIFNLEQHCSSYDLSNELVAFYKMQLRLGLIRGLLTLGGFAFRTGMVEFPSGKELK